MRILVTVITTVACAVAGTLAPYFVPGFTLREGAAFAFGAAMNGMFIVALLSPGLRRRKIGS